jgi:hypothetical protein
MKDVDPANLQGIREDMDLYDRIRDKVSGLTSILKDMNTLTPDMHRDSDFSEIYEGIERRMKEGPAPSSVAKSASEESKPAESPKPATNVSASNNSIGIGGINIGGNVSGNFVIGNNNQVNNNDKKQ